MKNEQLANLTEEKKRVVIRSETGGENILITKNRAKKARSLANGRECQAVAAFLLWLFFLSRWNQPKTPS